jgi:signal transduction histidine kinase
MSMPPPGPRLTVPFQLRRRRISYFITALAIGTYALLSSLFLFRLVADFSLVRVGDLIFMLAGLAANGLSLVWLRQEKYTRSAWSFMVANTLVVAVFSVTNPNNKALAGLLMGLGVAIYAGAVLPRRAVAPGILFAFCSGGLIATIDYLRPWERGRLNLTPSDPATLILTGLTIFIIVALARLYAGFPLNAKLLLATAGMGLFTSMGIFLPVYWVTQQMPPALGAWADTIEATAVVAAVISVAACSVAAQVFARSIIRPLQTVAAASEKVAAEDWPSLSQSTPDGRNFQAELHHLEQQSQDEIADLARAFIHMTDQLQQSQSGLRQNVQELRPGGEALVESESTLWTFINALPEAAFLLDPNGNFLATNQVIERNLEKTHQELVGAYAFSLLRPALAASRKAYFDQVLRTGQTVQFEDGSPGKYYINFMCPVFDTAGQIARVGVFSLDITERRHAETVIQTQNDQLAAQNEELQAKTAELLTQGEALTQAEAELRQLNAELERRVELRTAELAAVNEELETFSHSISHDLRAPLRAISGFTRLLEEDYETQLDPTARHFLERIQASVSHMGALIDNLLQLARLARTEPRRIEVNLSALAQSIMGELRAADPARQVHFVCAPGLKVQADFHLMRDVLQNLLGNAWKFTAKHPVARIELGRLQLNGQTVYFVRDDGAGFDMRYASKLFGTFQRLHTREEFNGTGVGLASVQRILQRHGGRIWAEAAVESGATFYFTLPDEITPA